MLIHLLLYWECWAHKLIHLLLYWECRAHMLIHLPLYWEWRAHMLIHLLLYGSAGLICSSICRSIGSARLMCSFICRSIGNGMLICTYSICCYVGEFLTFGVPSICFLPNGLFSAMLQSQGKKGQLREQLVLRFARSVRTPARLPGEALPIVSVRRIRRRRPASADRRAEDTILTVDSACTRVYT